MSWAGWSIAQPIISPAFLIIYNSTVELISYPDLRSGYEITVEPLHNGHLGDRQKVKVVERFKQESVYGLSTKKSGCVERWPLVEVGLYL